MTVVSRRRAAKRAGYTLIEVMMAIAVLAIGLFGIAALQSISIKGNMQAQQLTMATSLGREWIERLRADATNWTLGQNPGAGIDCAPGLCDICNTRYLTPTAWRVPGDGGGLALPADSPVTGYTPYGFQSAGFDHWGRDVPTTSANLVYCTNIRTAWVYRGSVVRADVRVFWHKRYRGNDTAARIPCTNGGALLLNIPGTNPGGRAALFENVSAVYLSTLIRFTPDRLTN